MSGEKIHLEKGFFRKENFFLGGGQIKEKFQLFKLDRLVKSMKIYQPSF